MFTQALFQKKHFDQNTKKNHETNFIGFGRNEKQKYYSS